VDGIGAAHSNPVSDSQQTRMGFHHMRQSVCMTVMEMGVSTQLVWLFVLAAPVACVAWTVTHEDIFADLRYYCAERSRHARQWAVRKFFYLFTCEYCFSHYIAAGGVMLVDLRLLVPGWRGTLLAWFATVWVANIYMSLFARLRLDIKRERVEITQEEHVAASLADADEAGEDERPRRPAH
jgi:hypothetical protein